MTKTESFERFIQQWAKWFNRIAMIALGFLLCVVVIDILSSKLFTKPLSGSIDVIGLVLVIIVGYAFAQTQLLGRHITVDFLVMRLPRIPQGILAIISSTFSLALWTAIIIMCLKYSIELTLNGESSITLRILYFPFGYALTLAFIPVYLAIILEFIKSIKLVR
ncbi:TRAP transporter small permease [Chloroflexota bacterium]